MTQPLRARINLALTSVTDPEYPDISIGDLGLVETVVVEDGGHVAIGLIPTFLGCPALEIIRTDVDAAVRSVAGVETCVVDFLASPIWTADRITSQGRTALANEYSVTIRGQANAITCPTCGSSDIAEISPFGSSICREVAKCRSCTNPLEVIRT